MATTKVGLFLVEKDRFLSECECPEHLCPHGSEPMEVIHWTVWDTRTDDYARDGDDFNLKREAVAHANKLWGDECSAAWASKTTEEMLG